MNQWGRNSNSGGSHSIASILCDQSYPAGINEKHLQRAFLKWGLGVGTKVESTKSFKEEGCGEGEAQSSSNGGNRFATGQIKDRVDRCRKRAKNGFELVLRSEKRRSSDDRLGKGKS